MGQLHVDYIQMKFAVTITSSSIKGKVVSKINELASAFILLFCSSYRHNYNSNSWYKQKYLQTGGLREGMSLRSSWLVNPVSH